MLTTHLAAPPTEGAHVEGFYSNNVDGAAKRDPEKVAGQFEAIFYRMLLEQAKIDDESNDPLFGSSEMSQMMSMFNDEIANVMGATGGLGIGKMLLAEAEKAAANGEFSARNEPFPGLLK